MLKWAVELGQFEISYEPRVAIKGQALADFIQEATHEERDQRTWTLFIDGSATTGGSGAGVFIKKPETEELEFAIKLDFKASNNEAEYEAMIRGLELAGQLGAQNLQIFSDLQLVVHQVREEFEARDERMIHYAGKVRSLMSTFVYCELSQIPSEENQRADFLARVGSSAIGGGNRKIELILGGRNKATPEVMNIQKENNWEPGSSNVLVGLNSPVKRIKPLWRQGPSISSWT